MEIGPLITCYPYVLLKFLGYVSKTTFLVLLTQLFSFIKNFDFGGKIGVLRFKVLQEGNEMFHKRKFA
jgi:hypothetical protein